MRLRSIAPWLIGAMLLGGCGAKTLPATGDMLAGAHASLADNDAATARQWLASAEPTLGNEHERKEYQLLMAEVEIRTGQADLALPAMHQLLAADPNDPWANEMAGKARLMLGEFSEARRHFNAALTGYRREADVSRAADLLALTDGLDAYAQGRFAQAEESWAGIGDDTLRAGVVGATAGTVSNTGPDHGTLARFNQPNR